MAVDEHSPAGNAHFQVQRGNGRLRVGNGGVGEPGSRPSGEAPVPNTADSFERADSFNRAESFNGSDSFNGADAIDMAAAFNAAGALDMAGALDITDAFGTAGALHIADAPDIADALDTADAPDMASALQTTDAPDIADALDTADAPDIADIPEEPDDSLTPGPLRQPPGPIGDGVLPLKDGDEPELSPPHDRSPQGLELKISVSLPPYGIEDLEQALRATGDGRFYQRVQTVALVLRGAKPAEVARWIGRSPRTVSNWVRRFQEAGVEGLRDRPRPGRPPRLSPSARSELRILLRRPPSSAGYAQRHWHPKLLGQVIRDRFGVAFQLRQCQRLFQSLKPGPGEGSVHPHAGFQSLKPLPEGTEAEPALGSSKADRRFSLAGLNGHRRGMQVRSEDWLQGFRQGLAVQRRRQAFVQWLQRLRRQRLRRKQKRIMSPGRRLADGQGWRPAMMEPGGRGRASPRMARRR